MSDIVDTLLIKPQITNNDTSTFSITNVIDQVENSFLDAEQSFQTFFMQAKDVNVSNDLEASLISSTMSDIKDIDEVQSSLFSSLGLGFLSIVDESSQANNSMTEDVYSFEQIQNNLLTLLQTGALKDKVQYKDNSNTETNEIEPIMDQDFSILNYEQVEQYVFGNNGLEINDGFDTVNILHHIPIVSNIYEESSQQQISAIAKLGGGFLYGGTLGLGYAALDLAVEAYSGSSIGDTIINFSFSDFFLGDNSLEQSSPIGYITKYRDDLHIIDKN